MLEDPRVNFAISTRGAQAGLDHLGFQVDDAGRTGGAGRNAPRPPTWLCWTRAPPPAATPAAKSTGSPTPRAWRGEHFHTLENIPVFNEAAAVPQGACCTPKQPLHPRPLHRPRAAARPNPLLPIAADLRPRMTESTTPLNVSSCAPTTRRAASWPKRCSTPWAKGASRPIPPAAARVTTSSPIRWACRCCKSRYPHRRAAQQKLGRVCGPRRAPHGPHHHRVRQRRRRGVPVLALATRPPPTGVCRPVRRQWQRRRKASKPSARPCTPSSAACRC